uniref:Aminotransferase-like plant mobile domain-containing protein n=1 Tax=Triticum urartu TaxID=4572 RepID=A0A8R7R767_TRIUA
MSRSGNCDDDELEVEQIPMPQGRTSDTDPNLEQAPNYTSRMSVKQVVAVIKDFSEYKKWLVTEIGFGEDVGKVFGIPCGSRDVKGRDADVNPNSVDFIKRTLRMDQVGAHSLRAAEEFLKRDITEDSGKLEKDCFQIAFVIVMMGHILVPSTKHNYATIDFWGALANPENIQQFNWCEYVLSCLTDSVTKLQKDLVMNVQTINLTGCHLFLQVFFLDNLELGIFTTKHDIFPRISAFDRATLRRMITMATDIGKSPSTYTSAMGSSWALLHEIKFYVLGW